MNRNWIRFAAIVGLLVLGLGIIGFAAYAVGRDGEVSLGDDGGWIIAAFLSLREVFSKIENIALGDRATEEGNTE